MTVVEQPATEVLQALCRQERNARREKRFGSLWLARLGHTAPEIAKGIGLSRQAVQEQVRQYNGEGLVGLQTRSRPGCELILSGDER
jgi:transposase